MHRVCYMTWSAVCAQSVTWHCIVAECFLAKWCGVSRMCNVVPMLLVKGGEFFEIVVCVDAYSVLCAYVRWWNVLFSVYFTVKWVLLCVVCVLKVVRVLRWCVQVSRPLQQPTGPWPHLLGVASTSTTRELQIPPQQSSRSHYYHLISTQPDWLHQDWTCWPKTFLRKRHHQTSLPLDTRPCNHFLSNRNIFPQCQSCNVDMMKKVGSSSTMCAIKCSVNW